MGLRCAYGGLQAIIFIDCVSNSVILFFMDTWSPLWSKIVDSSIWSEPDTVRILFVTMLALKDSDHVVRYSAFQLGQRAKKTEQEVLDALKILAAPDKKRLEPQPHEGRRIERVEDGWLILNGEEYRRKVSEEMKKARNRRSQTTYRAKWRPPMAKTAAEIAEENK